MDKSSTQAENLVSQILDSSIQGVVSDNKVTLEELNLERERLLIQKLNQDINSRQQDIDARKKFGTWIFIMVVAWLAVIIWIVISVGVGYILTFKIQLSDSVILGLIGSTTINVTAFFLVVTKYLFPAGQGESK
jgi:hypothetical protein